MILTREKSNFLDIYWSFSPWELIVNGWRMGNVMKMEVFSFSGKCGHEMTKRKYIIFTNSKIHGKPFQFARITLADKKANP